MQGKVIWFSNEKGYGELITSNEENYFFTYHAIQSKKEYKEIEDNMSVTFDLSKNNLFGRPAAINVAAQ